MQVQVGVRFFFFKRVQKQDQWEIDEEGEWNKNHAISKIFIDRKGGKGKSHTGIGY